MIVSRKRGLQYEAVAEVCDDLIANGYSPDQISCHRILAKTKTGSLSTILKHRERWLQGRQGLPHVVTVPDEHEQERASSEDAVATFWGETYALAELAAQYRLANDLKRASDKNIELQAKCRAILWSIKESERLLLSAYRRFDELMAAKASRSLRQKERLINSQPSLEIPLELGIRPSVDTAAAPVEGVGR